MNIALYLFTFCRLFLLINFNQKSALPTKRRIDRTFYFMAPPSLAAPPATTASAIRIKARKRRNPCVEASNTHNLIAHHFLFAKPGLRCAPSGLRWLDMDFLLVVVAIRRLSGRKSEPRPRDKRVIDPPYTCWHYPNPQGGPNPSCERYAFQACS